MRTLKKDYDNFEGKLQFFDSVHEDLEKAKTLATFLDRQTDVKTNFSKGDFLAYSKDRVEKLIHSEWYNNNVCERLERDEAATILVCGREFELEKNTLVGLKT